MANIPISIQLYTVRTLTEADFPAAMKQIAAIGYRYVELAGFGNLKSPAAAKKALDDAGLKASGCHVQLERLADINQVADEADILGHHQVIVPWIKPELRTADGYNYLATQLNAAAPALQKRGKELSYHNHDFDSHLIAGRPALDLFFEKADPNLIKFELDVFWAKLGGVDPVSFLQKLGNRVTNLHLKDQSKTDPTKFAEVGEGTLNFPTIMAAAAKLSVKFGVVEQDDCYGKNPLDVIRTSLTNLQRMGLA